MEKGSLLHHQEKPLVTVGGIVLLIFFLLPPAAITESSLLPFYNLGLMYAIIASVCIYRKLIKWDPVGLLALLYATSMAFSSLFNGGDLFGCITYYWPFAAALLLARALTPNYARELLWSVLLLCGFYVFANLVVIILVPTGTPLIHPDASNTFLGYRNGFCRFYLPALFASLLLDQVHGRRVSALSVSILFCSLAQSLLCYSATSLLALVLGCAIYPLLFNGRIRKKLSAVTYILGFLILFVAFVLFRLQNVLSIVFDLLGKDPTFVGRTYIWDASLERIDLDHFLFGYSGVSVPVISPEGMGVFYTAHNAILDIMVWGGFVATCIVAAMFVFAALNLYSGRNSVSSGTLSLYLGIFLLMGLVEHITCFALFLFLGIAAGWGFPGNNMVGPGLKTKLDVPAPCPLQASARTESVQKAYPYEPQRRSSVSTSGPIAKYDNSRPRIRGKK